VAALTVPCLYLLTGFLPMLNVTVEAVLFYQVPMLVGVMSAMRFFAPAQYFPLATSVLGVLQSFRFLPTLIGTLIRPHGHVFKVTPKGRDAAGRSHDGFTVVLAGSLLLATAVGFLLNSSLDTRVFADVSLFPVVAFWCGFNALVLLVVLVAAFSAPSQRGEERFEIDEPVLLRGRDAACAARIRDLSLSGMAARPSSGHSFTRDDWLAVTIAGVGEVPARVVRAGAAGLGLAFHLPASPERDRLIRKIFTGGHDNTTRNDDALGITVGMIESIFRSPPAAPPTVAAAAPAPPAWLLDRIAVRAQAQAEWDADRLAELRAAEGASGGEAA
jgi:cellulose synthase (UDP-forming)